MSTAVSNNSTSEDDVMRIKKKLEKMMKANEVDVSTSIDMLNILKKLNIDLHILKNTGIGVVLNNLRKSCNSDELGSLAKSLLKNWKKLLDASTSPNSKPQAPSDAKSNSSTVASPPAHANETSNGSPASATTTTTTTTTTTNSNGKRVAAGELSLENGHHPPPAKKDDKHNESTSNSNTNNSKNVETITTPVAKTQAATTTTTTALKKFNPLARTISFTSTKDEVRLKCREMLENALELSESIENGAELCDVKEIAARCEDVIFAEFKNTEMKYKNRIRSRVINLKDAKNPKLRESVRLGIITPDRLAVMAAEEMASDDLKNLRAKFTKEAIDDHQMARTQGAKTSLLKCGKCKKNNIVYSEMQTRSADEPMTTFAFCEDCGHRWKFC